MAENNEHVLTAELKGEITTDVVKDDSEVAIAKEDPEDVTFFGNINPKTDITFSRVSGKGNYFCQAFTQPIDKTDPSKHTRGPVSYALSNGMPNLSDKDELLRAIDSYPFLCSEYHYKDVQRGNGNDSSEERSNKMMTFGVTDPEMARKLVEYAEQTTEFVIANSASFWPTLTKGVKDEWITGDENGENRHWTPCANVAEPREEDQERMTFFTCFAHPNYTEKELGERAARLEIARNAASAAGKNPNDVQLEDTLCELLVPRGVDSDGNLIVDEEGQVILDELPPVAFVKGSRALLNLNDNAIRVHKGQKTGKHHITLESAIVFTPSLIASLKPRAERKEIGGMKGFKKSGQVAKREHEEVDENGEQPYKYSRND